MIKVNITTYRFKHINNLGEKFLNKDPLQSTV